MTTFDLSHPTVRVTWVKQRADRAVLTFENVQKKSVLYFDVVHENFVESMVNRMDPIFKVTLIGKVRDIDQLRREITFDCSETHEYKDICEAALIGDRLVPAVRTFLLALGAEEDIVEVK